MKTTTLLKMLSMSYVFAVLCGCENVSTDIQQHPSNKTAGESETLSGKNSLSVMNYDQIYQTYVTLTGVNSSIPPNSTTVENYYLNNKGSLPQNNDPSVLSAANMNAMTNLAAQFCQALIDNGTLRAAFYAGTPFTNLTAQNRNTLFGTPELRTQYVDYLIQKFWGLDLDSLPQRVSARARMITMMDELFSSSTANSNNEARALGISGCVAGLASAEVVLF